MYSAFRILFSLAVVLSLFSPVVAQQPATGRKLAVVIGVSTYRGKSGLPSLGKAPTNDASQLATVLRSQGFKVFEMTQDAARQEGQELMAPNLTYIRDQIDGILGFPNLGPDDSILISLHGHGVQLEEIDDAGDKTPRFFFCPADATINNPVTEVTIKTVNELTDRNHLLPLDELYTQLGTCTAATKLLIVDACRNDPNAPGEFRSGLASATLPKLPPPPGGTAAFFSCKPNQRAVQDAEQGYGIFNRYLVEGLQGKADLPLASKPADGIITFAELSAYVANNTYAHVYDKYNVKQSPELRGDYDLNMPLARVTPVRPNMFFPSSPVVPPTVSLTGSKAGETREITLSGGVKLVQVWCPAGSFTMGTPGATDNESPVQVTLSQGFWLGETEVTQGQWQAIMETTPWVDSSSVKEGAIYPAAGVSHEDAEAFCQKLTELEQQAGRLPSGLKYSLPTEAQWEYACRAGTTGEYSFEGGESQLGDHAWFDENTMVLEENYAHTVRMKKANPWGLYDMHGNVWEWCQDGYEEKRPGGRDPVVQQGSDKVARGGSWNLPARCCWSAYRFSYNPTIRYHHLGFRLAMSPSGP